MKYVLLEKDTNKIISCSSEDEIYCELITEDIIYPVEEIIPNISELKEVLELNKNMNEYQDNLINMINKSSKATEYLSFVLSSFNNESIVISTVRKDKTKLALYLQVSDEDWEYATTINANCYENGEFILKDFSTFKEKLQKKINELKNNINYESPTECLNINWVGGYESAQMLNAKRTLCLEMELEFCTFTDNEDADHVLTLIEAKEVCIKVAQEFEERRAAYKAKKRAIEACTTIEELEAILL